MGKPLDITDRTFEFAVCLVKLCQALAGQPGVGRKLLKQNKLLYVFEFKGHSRLVCLELNLMKSTIRYKVKHFIQQCCRCPYDRARYCWEQKAL